MATALHLLAAEDGAGVVRVVVEVPKGSASKFKYEPESGAFLLHRSLPAGMFFPHDYGFIPSTLGGDGDPLDALIFADTNAFPGCVVKTRLLGVISGTQKGERGRVENDIILAAHLDAASWKKVKTIRDLPAALLAEIEFFFTSYRNFQGKQFKCGRRRNDVHARRLVKEGIKRFREKNKPKG